MEEQHVGSVNELFARVLKELVHESMDKSRDIPRLSNV